jgi:hypothetical protein
MPRAEDGFWVVYQDHEAIGEIKGVDEANWLIDRLKEEHSECLFYRATYPTSRSSFTGKDKTHGLMRRKQNV